MKDSAVSAGSAGRKPLRREAWWNGAALVAVLVALGLGLTGCGGGAPKASSSPSLPSADAVSYAKALRFAKCLRAHGEPRFPSPDGSGLIQVINPKGVLRARSPQFERAQAACNGLFSGFTLQFIK